MKKILIVAMADSVHTARWIRQFDDDEIEFVLFPSTPHRRIHPLIKNRLEESGSTLKISQWMKFTALPLGVADLIFSNFFRAKLLAREIKNFKPDLIHVMETQHAGYLTDKALESINLKQKVILSIWGSDLYWFSQFSKHMVKLRSVLSKVDLLIMECRRDQELAINLGYTGSFYEFMPATGGMNTELLSKKARIVAPKDRKWIAVKGYSGFVGLGKDAVKVVAKIESQIEDFSVFVYSVGLGTWWNSRNLRKKMGARLVMARKHTLTNNQIEEMFLKSRVALGLSLSDGLPATVKEAMCMGAFPIQTSTSCAAEWFTDGVGGILVQPNDSTATATALLRVLRDDQLVDNAMDINLKQSEYLFSSKVLTQKAKSLYSSVLEEDL